MTTHIFLGLHDLTMISLVVELGARKLDSSMGRKEQKIAYGDGQKNIAQTHKLFERKGNDLTKQGSSR